MWLEQREQILFSSDALVLRLMSAVLMEISEEWETTRKYLTMEPG